MENNNESNKDSIYADKNSKGWNFGAKVYLSGNGLSDDSTEKMLERLKHLTNSLQKEYGSDAPY